MACTGRWRRPNRSTSCKVSNRASPRWTFKEVITAAALGGVMLLIATFAIGRLGRAMSGWGDPEQAIATDTYYPDDDDLSLHVRHYKRCNRYRECKLSGFDVRDGGKRRSIGTAGLSGEIRDYRELNAHSLLITINGTDIIAYSALGGGINGSGFRQAFALAPTERWIDVSAREAHPDSASYLIAGTRLIAQGSLQQVGTVPDFRPVYYDGTDLYLLEHAGAMLRLHAMKLPSTTAELLDAMPAECLNEQGAQQLMDAQEVAQSQVTNKTLRRTALGGPSVNDGRAASAFKSMAQLPRTSERMTFYGLRMIDYFDRYKSQCRDFAMQGMPSFEELSRYNEDRLMKSHVSK
jgi:hypothetical protein